VTALLQVRGVRAGYGAVEVLRGIDLDVGVGEAVALLGSNGAGKSTLNNVMSGLLPAWSGRVMFDGADLTRTHYREVVKAGLIQVPEGRRIFPNLTVLENLELGAFTRALEVITGGMQAGLFPARPGSKGYNGHENCGFCSYASVCHPDRERLWERKRNGPEFADYLALAGESAAAEGAQG
jgi:ABC-type sugar transport system ATPase subunit